jgi:hypothetical protein
VTGWIQHERMEPLNRGGDSPNMNAFSGGNLVNVG